MDRIQHQHTDVNAISLIQAEYAEFAFKRHYHLDYHIGLITRGQQHYYYRGARHYAGPGQVVLLPPDEIHDGQAATKQGYDVRIFDIEPDWLHQVLGCNDRSLHYQHHNIDDALLFHDLILLHQRLPDEQFSSLGKDCLSWQVFTSMFERYVSHEQRPEYRLGQRSLGQIRDYMEAHLSEKITLEQIATLCDLSPTQLLRQFKKATQMTPYAYLARLRLEKAWQKLRQGERSTDVAHQVGFYDQAHFVNAFKQTFHLTPSQVSPNIKKLR